jgi:hypothetical protein
MNLVLLEKELKKRTAYPYQWGTKQNNVLDDATNFIYKIPSFDLLLDTIEINFKGHSNYQPLKNYALNRWYNFWSAQGIEALFCKNDLVRAHENSRDKYVDFYIQHIPFDHKTTVFPKGFKKSPPYAITHREEFLTWLYLNQSAEKRQHFCNRLFIVLVDYSQENAPWKLKAELNWLNQAISTYLRKFDATKLQKIIVKNTQIYADIIWAVK